MNADDAVQWHERVDEVLTQNNLNWVLEQVEQHVRLGSISEEEIQTFRERRSGPTVETGSEVQSVAEASVYGKGRKAKFVAYREYTPSEILDIVINAVERVVADAAEMEADTLKQFVRGGIQYQVVLIREDAASTPTVLSSTDAATRAGSASRLRDLLNELRAEL